MKLIRFYAGMIAAFFVIAAEMPSARAEHSASSYYEPCENLIGTCEYYLCREDHRACGRGGYFLGFGHAYCRAYDEVASTFTRLGQNWLARVKACLQVKLEGPNLNRLSCNEIKDLAVDSHFECYIATGYCDIPYSDKWRVAKVAHDLIGDPDVVRTFFRIQRKCSLPRFQKTDLEWSSVID